MRCGECGRRVKKLCSNAESVFQSSGRLYVLIADIESIKYINRFSI